MRDLKIRLDYNYEDTIRTGCHIQARERTHWYTCNLTAFNGTIERIKFTGIPQSSKKKALCSTLSNLYLSLSDDERATAANVHRRRRCNQSLSPVRSINTSNLSRQSGDAQSPVYPGDFTDGDQITSPILSTNQDMITDELKPSEIAPDLAQPTRLALAMKKTGALIARTQHDIHQGVQARREGCTLVQYVLHQLDVHRWAHDFPLRETKEALEQQHHALAAGTNARV